MSAATTIDALLHQVQVELAQKQRFPESTFRLQFHAGFTFRDACQLVPYLSELGITDCYASPYLKARAGSTHGYDIMDHRVLNPEIGTPQEYDEFVEALHAHGLGQLLDIVPNHMGVIGNENAWWNDVLENGPGSQYASFFDIDWYPVKPALQEKVLLPVLGGPYGKVLESQELRLSIDGGNFAVHYFDHRFPIAPQTTLSILGHREEELKARLGDTAPELMEYQSILTAIKHLPPRSDTQPERIAERQREKEIIKRRLSALAESSPPVLEHIQENVALFNGTLGEPRSFDLLDNLLNSQAYRLAFWRVAADEINYRRFFDINELAAINTERPEVFAATHELILQLLRDGKVNGLRIDHPDGLYDPKQYLQRLQAAFTLQHARRFVEAQPDAWPQSWKEMEPHFQELLERPAKESLHRPLYVVVEKILEPGEKLPEDWPCHGTTGYMFTNMVNGLFVDATQEPLLTRIYERWIDAEVDFETLVYEKKFLIMQVALSSELQVLALQLDRLSEKYRWSRDFTLNSLRHALREIIACFPVYRSYISNNVLPERDRHYVETAVARARQKSPAINASIFEFAKDMILLRYPDPSNEADCAEQRRFIGKFQQVTGPVMAKGLEDTSYYVYNRLISLNEVGGDPKRFGSSPSAFHQYNQRRQQYYPHALSATSTHDTKRSEDARARIDVLSELPREWQRGLARWGRLNKRYRVAIDNRFAPDRNDEYLLYQALVGAWPLGDVTEEMHVEFVGRIQAYMQKALHEAKVHSSWINPNRAYDEAVAQFVANTLDRKKNQRFVSDFAAFQKRISRYGMFNSLAQTLLKITSPGVPDIYQGTELWDFSLVDPDNRRPVDYERRRRMLQEVLTEMQAAGDSLPQFARTLTDNKDDGRIKLYVTALALRFRRGNTGLLSEGEYLPAETVGLRNENLVAFSRKKQERWAIVVAPRLVTRLLPSDDAAPLGKDVWQDTVVLISGIAPHLRCRNIFTGEILTTWEQDGLAALAASEVLANFPVALLTAC